MTKILNFFKKLPVGVLVFLAFAVTGIGTAEVMHQKNIQESEFSEQGVGLVSNETKSNVNLNAAQNVQSSGLVSEKQKHKSDDDSEVRQSSKSRGDDEDENEEGEDDGDDDSRGGTVVTQPTTTPTQTTPNTTVQTFTMAQVSTHNSQASCYSVVNGSVYDLTNWISQHPGGSSAIISMCGIDASSAFNGQHGGQARPASELAGFKIGVLVQ